MGYRTASLRWLAAATVLVAAGLRAQVPTQCLEIESMLVDACNSACPGAQEGQNEMFRFITGPAPIDLNDLEAVWATQNAFLGWVQNATTASLTSQLNATIQSCGWLLEPPGGIIPPGRRVLGITSTDLCVAGNSFAALSDTLYVIFQQAGNTQGHFKNTNNSTTITASPTGGVGFRTFELVVVSVQCSDEVTYDQQWLTNQQGSYGGPFTLNDGASVEASWPGTASVSYVNYGCQAPVPVLLPSIEAPTIAPCATSVQLTATVVGTASQWGWSGGTGTFSDPAAFSTTYTFGPGESGGATVQFCVQSTCGQSVCDDVQLVVSGGAAPQVTAIAPNTVCASGTQLQATITGNYSAVQWSGGSGTWSNATGTTPTYVPGPNELGNVDLQCCATGGCAGDACDVVTLQVLPAPTVAIAADGPLALCPGTSVQLTATSNSPLVWNDGSTNASFTANTAGTYTATASNSCGSASTSVQVTALAALQATIDGPAALCAGQIATLTATGDGAYAWSTGATTNTTEAQGPGTYAVVVTNTCGDATASLTIAPGVSLSPVIVADATSGCAPLCTVFSLEELPAACDLVWDLGAMGTVNGVTANACFPVGTHAVSVVAAPQQPGAYCMGASAQSVQVVAWPSPEPVATADRYLVSDDDPVVHLWDDGSGATSWSWDIGDGYVLTTGSAVDVELHNIGCYTVELTAQNVHGCSARSTTTVCADGLEGVYLPNAFTPNGDGVNDDFHVVTNVRVLADYELAVFDRWGQVLFSSRDQSTGWNAEGIPIGVYVWKLWYTASSGPQQRVGHVTVVR